MYKKIEDGPRGQDHLASARSGAIGPTTARGSSIITGNKPSRETGFTLKKARILCESFTASEHHQDTMSLILARGHTTAVTTPQPQSPAYGYPGPENPNFVIIVL